MAKTIAVTGKGGTGKTAIAALIIKYLVERTPGPVLALDADPDANLGAVLGIPVEKTLGDLREETLAQMKDFPAGMSKGAFIEAGLHQIVVERPKLDLISMGRAEGPSCYCYINNLLRKFADSLNAAYPWVVMDNEAGMEHLSRRTASRVDHLMVIVNENPLSLNSARKIDELLAQLKNPIDRKYLLLNMVSEERIGTVRARAAGLSFEYLDAIPYDGELEELIFRGEPIFHLQNGPAFSKINQIMERIGAE